MRAMFHLGSLLRRGLLFAGFARNSTQPPTLEQLPEPQASGHPDGIRFKNSISRAQLGCARAKLPPYCSSNLAWSIFAEWGLVQANTRRGVFRVRDLTIACAFRAAMSHARV